MQDPKSVQFQTLTLFISESTTKSSKLNPKNRKPNNDSQENLLKMDLKELPLMSNRERRRIERKSSKTDDY